MFVVYGIIALLLIHAIMFWVNKITANIKKNSLLKSQANSYHLWFQIFAMWVRNIHKKKSISDYLIENNYKNIAIYGAGAVCELVCEELDKSEVSVVYLIDQNACFPEISKEIVELDIICVDDIPDQKKIDAIIVTPVYDFNRVRKKIIRTTSEIPVISLDQIIYSL